MHLPLAPATRATASARRGAGAPSPTTRPRCDRPRRTWSRPILGRASAPSPPAARSASTASPTRCCSPTRSPPRAPQALRRRTRLAPPRRRRRRASTCASARCQSGAAERLRDEPRPAGGRRHAGDAGRRDPDRAGRRRRVPRRPHRRARRLTRSRRPLRVDLLADPLQGAAQDARDVHLRVADLLGDLRLGHVLDEAQPQDQPLALVEVGEGAFERELALDQLEALVLVADPLRGRRFVASSPPAGRSSESGRRLWLASSTSSTSVGSTSSFSAISPTEGERCSSSVSSPRSPCRPPPCGRAGRAAPAPSRRGRGNGASARRGSSARRTR